MKCGSCGSSEIIDGVKIIDRGVGVYDLSATIYKKPGAALFKGAVSSPLTGRLCANCGRVELFVADPRELIAAALVRSSNKGK